MKYLLPQSIGNKHMNMEDSGKLDVEGLTDDSDHEGGSDEAEEESTYSGWEGHSERESSSDDDDDEGPLDDDSAKLIATRKSRRRFSLGLPKRIGARTDKKKKQKKKLSSNDDDNEGGVSESETSHYFADVIHCESESNYSQATEMDQMKNVPNSLAGAHSDGDLIQEVSQVLSLSREGLGDSDEKDVPSVEGDDEPFSSTETDDVPPKSKGGDQVSKSSRYRRCKGRASGHGLSKSFNSRREAGRRLSEMTTPANDENYDKDVQKGKQRHRHHNLSRRSARRREDHDESYRSDADDDRSTHSELSSSRRLLPRSMSLDEKPTARNAFLRNNLDGSEDDSASNFEFKVRRHASDDALVMSCRGGKGGDDDSLRRGTQSLHRPTLGRRSQPHHESGPLLSHEASGATRRPKDSLRSCTRMGMGDSLPKSSHHRQTTPGNQDDKPQQRRHSGNDRDSSRHRRSTRKDDTFGGGSHHSQVSSSRHRQTTLEDNTLVSGSRHSHGSLSCHRRAILGDNKPQQRRHSGSHRRSIPKEDLLGGVSVHRGGSSSHHRRSVPEEDKSQPRRLSGDKDSSSRIRSLYKDGSSSHHRRTFPKDATSPRRRHSGDHVLCKSEHSRRESNQSSQNSSRHRRSTLKDDLLGGGSLHSQEISSRRRQSSGDPLSIGSLQSEISSRHRRTVGEDSSRHRRSSLGEMEEFAKVSVDEKTTEGGPTRQRSRTSRNSLLDLATSIVEATETKEYAMDTNADCSSKGVEDAPNPEQSVEDCRSHEMKAEAESGGKCLPYENDTLPDLIAANVETMVAPEESVEDNASWGGTLAGIRDVPRTTTKLQMPDADQAISPNMILEYFVNDKEPLVWIVPEQDAVADKFLELNITHVQRAALVANKKRRFGGSMRMSAAGIPSAA